MSTYTEPAISIALADRVYTVLVEEVGALDGGFQRLSFGIAQTSSRPPTEWRIAGGLGKFWRNGGRWYVAMNREDERPEYLERIARANEKLARLREEAVAVEQRQD